MKGMIPRKDKAFMGRTEMGVYREALSEGEDNLEMTVYMFTDF